jgi:glutathione synthase/RimK-type ligase-like ATP-grasp enzyme
VHVFGQTVIDIQQKRKKRGYENERDTRIRNMANGYVYCRDGITPPDSIDALAVRAVRACGYHYGAVDIVFNAKNNRLAVLEVNSRPGLLGTTLDKYSDALVSSFDLRVR